MIPLMPGRDLPLLLDYDLRPPQDLRVFPVPQRGILRADDDVLVTETVRDGDVVRHYAFRHHWVKVHVRVDAHGQPSDPAAEGHAITCDIATPMRWEADAVYAVDLWLEVLVTAAGDSYVVVDEHDIDKAVEEQWLSEREAAAARHALDGLLAMIEGGGLLDFLDVAQPFAPPVDPPPAEIRHVPLRQVPLLQPGIRPTW